MNVACSCSNNSSNEVLEVATNHELWAKWQVGSNSQTSEESKIISQHPDLTFLDGLYMNASNFLSEGFKVIVGTLWCKKSFQRKLWWDSTQRHHLVTG